MRRSEYRRGRGSLRHAETIEAMGMLPALRAVAPNAASDAGPDGYGDPRGRAMSSMSRTCRYMMQIAVLPTGAVLVIRQEVSAGSMVAASIIMGRMLMPFDSMIDGWRQWVLALTAWKKISDLLENQAPNARPGRPRARRETLIVDRLVYAPPGPTCRHQRLSFLCRQAKCSALSVRRQQANRRWLAC